MEVPEDIREKANELYRELSKNIFTPQRLIAQALLSERLAQKERDAKIAESMPITSPHYTASAIRNQP